MSKKKKFIIGSGTFIILLLFSFWYFFIYFPEPKGFILLREAKTAIENKEYRRANFILEDARESGFGFCGNTYLEMLPKVDSLRVHCLFETEEYEQVRHVISHPHFFSNYKDYYLIKSLLQEFGAEEVSNSFIAGMNHIYFEREYLDPEFLYNYKPNMVYAFIPLLNKNINLKLEVTSRTFESKVNNPNEILQKRVEDFMNLSNVEQIEAFKTSWQYLVLSGEQPLFDYPFH